VRICDFAANNPPGKTPLAGTGNVVERRDQGDGSTYGQLIASWDSVTNTATNFGFNNYTSLDISQLIIEVTATPGITVVLGPRVRAF
jgi:hypothetical protein